MRSLRFQIDGLELHVAAWGGPETAPPLLLMHGGMAHAQWWSPLARYLRSALRPFALDRRGHGHSDWADVSEYGWERDLEDAEHVASRLDSGPWLVVGHSQGGLLSVHLALRGRFPIGGLIVVDSPFQPRAPALVRAGRNFRRVPQVRYDSLEAAIRRFQPYPSPHRVPEDVLRDLARASFKPTDDGGFVSRFHWRRFQAEDGPEHPLSSFPEDVARITVPTLVLRGEHSSILSAEDHSAFVRRLPRGTGRQIEETTHSLHVERPEAVADAILSFASSLAGTTLTPGAPPPREAAREDGSLRAGRSGSSESR